MVYHTYTILWNILAEAKTEQNVGATRMPVDVLCLTLRLGKRLRCRAGRKRDKPLNVRERFIPQSEQN